MTFHYYLPGIVLIAASLLIIVFPQILVVLVAALVFMAGVGALWMGNTMRLIHKHGQSQGPGSVFFGHWRQ